MNTDAFFKIGKSHKVCQDYAYASSDSVMVRVSDGCSSSRDTDVGARILCRAYGDLSPENLRDLTLKMGLPEEALDATLLTAEVVKDQVRIQIEGDGLVAARRKSGGYVLIKSEFPSGAPRYRSYDLNPDRRKRYVEKFGEGNWKIEIQEGRSFLGMEVLEITNGDLKPYQFIFPVEGYDLIVLFSDGALSFHGPCSSAGGGRVPIPPEDIVEEMLAVKMFAGEFIQRRALKFLKDAAKKDWQHEDDFSVAAIHLGD